MIRRHTVVFSLLFLHFCSLIALPYLLRDAENLSADFKTAFENEKGFVLSILVKTRIQIANIFLLRPLSFEERNYPDACKQLELAAAEVKDESSSLVAEVDLNHAQIILTSKTKDLKLQRKAAELLEKG